MIGIKLRLFDDVTPRADLTGIQAIYWDAEEPVYADHPVGKSAVVTTDSEGDAYIDLSGVTELGVGDYGFLTLYQPNISDPRKSLAFMGRVQLSEISAGAYMPPRFVATDVPQYETDALINFFHATDGPNWTTNTGWGIDPVVGNWHGITVENGHVTKLNLSGNVKTLSGPGVPFLVALSELDYLNLFSTGVTGSISVFNSLVNLNYLDLGYTGVTGDINVFYSLVNLNHLRLDGTGIAGDISGLNILVNLISLVLSATRGITGDISGLNILVNLTNLRLDGTGVLVDTTPVFVKSNGTLRLGGNPAPTWGTSESPTQVTLNIVANLKNGWTVTVTGGIPTWVQDMV